MRRPDPRVAFQDNKANSACSESLSSPKLTAALQRMPRVASVCSSTARLTASMSSSRAKYFSYNPGRQNIGKNLPTICRGGMNITRSMLKSREAARPNGR
jgi:hypothetical protein